MARASSPCRTLISPPLDPTETLRGGDPVAIGRLFDAHYDVAFAFAARFLGDAHDAADAVQDAFLRILRYRTRFEGRGRFEAWLMRVVRNACIDLAASRRREQAQREKLPVGESVAPPALPDDRVARLRTAVASLAEERRTALILRRYHDLSYGDIGRRLGITAGAARVRVHRAMQELQLLLADPPPDADQTGGDGP